jgi:hypothetical protein
VSSCIIDTVNKILQYRVIINVSYIVVGCGLWYTYNFAASSGLVNLTFDSLQLVTWQLIVYNFSNYSLGVLG